MKMRQRRKRRLYDPDYAHMKCGYSVGLKSQVIHTVGQFSIVRKQRIYYTQTVRIK